MTSENPFLGFEGRIGRGTYWVCSAILISATLTTALIGFLALVGIHAARGANIDQLLAPGAPLPTGFSLLAVLFAIALAYPTLSYTAKRLHDVNQSGYWGLILVVPSLGLLVLNLFGIIDSNSTVSTVVDSTFLILSLAFIVILGCIPGTPGYNAHGNNPVDPEPGPAGFSRH